MVLVLALIATGCKKKVKPVSERIAKTWTAESVKHASTTVYTKGAASNSVPGYSGFKLSLSSSGNTVAYTEWDGTTFNGTWELQGDQTLILKNLVPQPSGSGGTVEFSILSIDNSKLVLKNLKESKKTGNTINEYSLTNP